MKIRDVMTTDVEVADPDDTLHTAARMMADLDVGVLPVRDGGKLVGMITDRDIAVRGVAEDLNPETAQVRQIMTAELHHCAVDDEVEEVADKMTVWQVRRLPVLDREQRFVGIVSLGDLSLSDEAVAGEALRGVAEGTGEAPGQASSSSGLEPRDLGKGGF